MVLAVIEHTEYPFAKGDLTSDGIQWSAEKDTTTADVDVEVGSVTIKPPALGELIEVEFGLTAAFRVQLARKELLPPSMPCRWGKELFAG